MRQKINNECIKQLVNYAHSLKKNFSTNSQSGNRRYTTFYIYSVIDEALENIINQNGDDENDKK